MHGVMFVRLCAYLCVTVGQGCDIREQTEIAPRSHFGTRRHTQTHIPTFVEGEAESAGALQKKAWTWGEMEKVAE